MKLVTPSILSAAFLTTLAVNTQAQIVWTTPSAITGYGNISSVGTAVDAITAHNITTYGNASQPSSLTVKDTKFNIGNLSDSTFSFTSPLGVGDGGDGNAPDGLNAYQSLSQQPPAPSSINEKNYNELLTQCTYSGGPVTVTMSGLLSGATYQVQIWNSTGRQTTFTSGVLPANSVILTGADYSLGEFTLGAGQTSESFSYIESGANNLGVVSDVALRVIPEPSTYAMMLGGLAVLAFLARRRDFQNK